MNNKGKSTLEVMEKTLRRRNYSNQTIRTYCSYAKKFLLHFDKDAYHISTKKAKEYLEDYNYSSISQQNQMISAVKFLYKEVIGIKLRDLKLTRPRKQKPLPKLMNYEETVKQVRAIKNLKHKAILSLALETGLRVSEIINLKIDDVDSSRMVIYVRNSKGNKDRIVPLSNSLLSVLRAYYKVYKPKQFLFNGMDRDRYSTSSINSIVKRYTDNRNHIHLFRHLCFSTMVDKGVDVSVVQKLAGHSNVNTTSNYYLHLSNKTFNQIPSLI